MGYPWWHRLPRNCHGNWAVVKTTHAAPGGRNPTIQSQKKWARMVKTWNEHISIGFKFEDPPQQIRHLILRKQKQNILWEIALFCHGRNLQCGRWTTSNPVQLQQLNRNSWGWSTIFYVSKFFIYNCAQCNNYIHWIILNRWIVSWSSKSPFISTSVHLAAALV